MKQALIIAGCFFAANILGLATDTVAEATGNNFPFEYLIIPIIIPLRTSQKVEKDTGKNE